MRESYILFSSVHIFSFSKLLEKRGNYKPFYFLILTTLKRQNVMRDYNISLQLLTPTCVKKSSKHLVMEYKCTKARKELRSTQIKCLSCSLSLFHSLSLLSTTLILLLMFDCSFWNACKMDFRFNVLYPGFGRRVLTGFLDTCIILLSFYGSNVLLVFKIVEFS